MKDARDRGFKRDANYSDDEDPVFEPSAATKQRMQTDKRYYSRFISPFMEDLQFRTSAHLAEVIHHLCDYWPDGADDDGHGSDKAYYMVYCKLQELYYEDSKARHMRDVHGEAET